MYHLQVFIMKKYLRQPNKTRFHFVFLKHTKQKMQCNDLICDTDKIKLNRLCGRLNTVLKVLRTENTSFHNIEAYVLFKVKNSFQLIIKYIVVTRKNMAEILSIRRKTLNDIQFLYVNRCGIAVGKSVGLAR